MEGSSPTPGPGNGSGPPAAREGGRAGPRVVFHVDMDAFYAAVEARDDPSLRSIPLVVGADPKGGHGRGVVCTANYPARAYGIRSAMPISKAYELCPHATFVRPDFGKYSEASERVMEVLATYAAQTGPNGETGILEVVGMDEAYLDLTELCAAPGHEPDEPDWSLASSIARSLQAAVKRATGLSCSVGVAPNKSIAKVASDRHKPHGVTRVTPSEVTAFLEPLPVRSIPGCGPKTSARLAEWGLPTVGDLARLGRVELTRRLGSHGEWLHALATGQDDRRVVADRGDCKSRSNERTFEHDEPDPARVRAVAHRLLAGLLEDMRDDGRAFATLTAKLRYSDYTTLTRSHTVELALEPGSPATAQVAADVLARLLDPILDGRRVRLIGVRLAGFTAAAGQRALTAFGMDPGHTRHAPVQSEPVASWEQVGVTGMVPGHASGLAAASVLAPGLRHAFHPGGLLKAVD